MGRINLVVLAGNMVRDPELRYTPSGMAICEFTIANNKTWMSDNEKKEKVNFVNCICWGKRGEVVSKYFSKGKPIQVEGELDFQSWENEKGEKKSALKINVKDFDFIGGKAEGDGGGAGNNASNAQEPSFPEPKIDVNEEEIPF